MHYIIYNLRGCKVMRTSCSWNVTKGNLSYVYTIGWNYISAHIGGNIFCIFFFFSLVWCNLWMSPQKGEIISWGDRFLTPLFFASLFHCQLLRVILTQLLSLTEVQKQLLLSKLCIFVEQGIFRRYFKLY